MRHFLQYWKNYNPEYELETPLNFAASAQFKKLKKGDVLWIVALRKRSPLLEFGRNRRVENLVTHAGFPAGSTR